MMTMIQGIENLNKKIIKKKTKTLNWTSTAEKYNSWNEKITEGDQQWIQTGRQKHQQTWRHIKKLSNLKSRKKEKNKNEESLRDL